MDSYLKTIVFFAYTNTCETIISKYLFLIVKLLITFVS